MEGISRPIGFVPQLATGVPLVLAWGSWIGWGLLPPGFSTGYGFEVFATEVCEVLKASVTGGVLLVTAGNTSRSAMSGGTLSICWTRRLSG